MHYTTAIQRCYKLTIGLGLAIACGTTPVWAQASNQPVQALVEALRQAAPQTGREDDGLYTEWQIKPENIPRWSRSCLGRSLTATQLDASPVTARGVVTCVMRDVLAEQQDASQGNTILAVRRAAAWWMTGDPDQHGNARIATYLDRVVTAYQQQMGATALTVSPEPAPIAPPPVQASEYDRYMRAAYDATTQRDYDTALLYFRRALDERPNDSYAQQAIANVEQYRRTAESPTPSPQPSSPSLTLPSTDQAQ